MLKICHTIKKQCIARAFDSELQIFNFYMSQDKVTATSKKDLPI